MIRFEGRASGSPGAVPAEPGWRSHCAVGAEVNSFAAERAWRPTFLDIPSPDMYDGGRSMIPGLPSAAWMTSRFRLVFF